MVNTSLSDQRRPCQERFQEVDRLPLIDDEVRLLLSDDVCDRPENVSPGSVVALIRVEAEWPELIPGRHVEGH